MDLKQVFDSRNNALNAWRLALAVGVVFWHSWVLSGHPIQHVMAQRLLGEVFVDGFFALSGFLITASWLRRPSLRAYWVARSLRIFPGLWVCVIVTAFAIAPIGVAIAHGSPARLFSSSGPFEYVLNNGAFNANYAGIDGTPTGVPVAGVWNGSLWTLFFEMLCYLMIAVLGVTGLLKRRWTLPVLFVVMWCWSAYISYPTDPTQTFPQVIARFTLMFLAGAVIYQFSNIIPARWSLVTLSLAIVVAAGLIQNYRVLGAVPLAYAVIVSGALLKKPQLNLRHDLSYGVYIYAFPIQQLLIICGLASLTPWLFFVLATAAILPVAALSWFLVEQPALSLKKRFEQESATPHGRHARLPRRSRRRTQVSDPAQPTAGTP